MIQKNRPYFVKTNEENVRRTVTSSVAERENICCIIRSDLFLEEMCVCVCVCV